MSRTSRLTPISRPGIMIGSVIAIRTPLRNGSRERTSGNAAAVPTIVEIERHLGARPSASS